MIYNENILTLDFDKDYDEELVQAQSIIQEVLKKRKKNRLHQLYREALETKEPTLIALGAAMMLEHHVQISEVLEGLPCGPSKDSIAYYIAKNHLAERPLTDNLRQKLLDSFDVMGFVFDHTDYDECDNGHFYRRS